MLTFERMANASISGLRNDSWICTNRNRKSIGFKGTTFRYLAFYRDWLKDGRIFNLQSQVLLGGQDTINSLNALFLKSCNWIRYIRFCHFQNPRMLQNNLIFLFVLVLASRLRTKFAPLATNSNLASPPRPLLLREF